GVVDANLDEHVFALHGDGGVEFDDFDDGDELVELFCHLLEWCVFDVDDDCDAGEAFDFGFADGEGFDVEAAACEQAGDAGEESGLVFDEEGQYVRHCYSSSHSGACSLAYCTEELPTPWGTMGHTMASALTMKSMTTGRSLVSFARVMAASTSSFFVTRMPR